MKQTFYLRNNIAIPVFRRSAAHLWVCGHVINVEFDGVCTGAFHHFGVMGPTASRNTVHAGNNRDSDALLGLRNVFQIGLRSHVVWDLSPIWNTLRRPRRASESLLLPA